MEHQKKMLKTAGLLSIENNKLLLAYSNHKKAWYLPGGKIDEGETSLMAIKREILEELSINISDDQLTYYCHISAQAYGEEEHTIMEQDCFLYHSHQKMVPSNEIGAIKFFSHDEYLQQSIQVIGVLKIYEKLKQDGLIL